MLLFYKIILSIYSPSNISRPIAGVAESMPDPILNAMYMVDPLWTWSKVNAYDPVAFR